MCARACERVYVCVCVCVCVKTKCLRHLLNCFCCTRLFKLLSVSIALFSFVVLVVLHTVMMIVLSWFFVVVVMVAVLSRLIYLLHFDFGNNLPLFTSFYILVTSVFLSFFFFSPCCCWFNTCVLY